MQDVKQPIDLAFIIDLIADAGTLDLRRAFAAEVQDMLNGQLGRSELLRTALLAYGGRPPLRSFALAIPPVTAGALASLGPVDFGPFTFEQPFEKALLGLRELKWRDSALHVILTIGSRPPNPAEARPEWRQKPSADGNWRNILKELRSRLKLYSISILCPIYWPLAPGAAPLSEMSHFWPYLVSCWIDLGYSGMFDAEIVTPADIARLISSELTD